MKLKHIFLLTITLLSTAILFAQEDAPESPWNVGGDASLTFFQSSFTNWTDGGGDPTTNIGFLGNFYAKYKKENLSWENTFLLQYNLQKVGVDAPFFKSADRLEMLSVGGYKVSENLDYSLLFSLKTQLTSTIINGTLKSDFFAPGEILLAPGIKYAKGSKKTKDNILINFSPATAKFLIVANNELADIGTFTGVPAVFDTNGIKLSDGQRFRFEFGASLIGNYRINFIDTDDVKATWLTNLELFSNYLENPEDIDVKWTNVVTANFLKYFSLSLSTDLRYDEQVKVPIDTDGDGINDSTGSRVRFAQTFGVGVGYKF